MNNKSVSAATIGYMGFALGLWVVGMDAAGWLPTPPSVVAAVQLPLAILLLVVGIPGFTNDRVLDTVIFLGGAALYWTATALVRLRFLITPAAPHGLVSAGFEGWFLIVWAAFFAWVFIAALKMSFWRVLFLLGMWLWLLAAAIANWSASQVIGTIGGYIMLATAVLAGIVSALEITGHSGHLKEESATAGSASA